MVGPIFLPLATVMGFNRNQSATAPPETKRTTEFDDHLAETITESINRAARDGRSVQITVSERQNAGDTAGNRQFVITVDPTPAPKSDAATPPPPARQPLETDWNPPLRSATSGSVFDMENPIPKVKDLLEKMGISASGIKFELVDDVINNLGGSYVNHLMRVNMPNGWKEDFAVEYIHRNPKITANEIASLNRKPAAPDHLRGV